MIRFNIALATKRRLVRRLCTMLLAGMAGLIFSPGLDAAEPNFLIGVNKSRFINLPASTDRITVGNPGVADVRLLDPTHLYILGRSLGTTNVTLCRRSDCFSTVEVEVTHDLDALKSKLYQLFPEERPKVFSSQGAIVLSGQVSSLQKMGDIEAIARTYVHKGEESPSQMPNVTSTTVTTGAGAAAGMGMQPGASPSAPHGQDTDVINLMQVGGPQQVMLGVTVAEINRRLARRLKVDFSVVGAGGDFTAGAVRGDALVSALTQALAVAPSVINPAGLFFRFIGNDAAVKTVINAAKENGLAKILAEPNLTTISGQDAAFLSGGEFPIPVPQSVGGTGSGNTVTIQFKEFGVALKFLPVVLDSGRISLKLNISVSEISADNAVIVDVAGASTAFVVPSLTKRSANSSLELDDGQTLGIAGLISDSMRETVSKFPGLGDIPILGQLFTSQDYLKNETELVIFVTPHLVRPIAQDRIRLPTDTFVEPGDAEFYWLGRTEALDAPARRATRQFAYGGLRGHFGQQP
jgi:pilus assembly protein CpaC